MAYPPTANQPSTVTFFFSRSLCYPLSVIHRRKNKDCFLKRATAFLPPLKTALEKSESPRLDRIENRQMEKRIDKWKKKNNNEKHIKKVKKNWNNSIKRNSKKKKKKHSTFSKERTKIQPNVIPPVNSSSDQNYFFLPFTRKQKAASVLKFPAVSRFNLPWNNSRFQSNRHRPQSSINVSFKERNPFAESSRAHRSKITRGPTPRPTQPCHESAHARVERQTSPLVPLRVFPIYAAPRIRGQRRNEVLNQRNPP